MQNVQTKICGTTNLADARYCASLGADYLGFIQYLPSPRYVEPSLAREIIEWVEGPLSVGVFVDEDAGTINKISSDTGFDLVQLHGHEAPDFCARIERPVVKAIRVGPSDAAEDLLRVMETYESSVQSFLLDTYVEGTPGGTGKSFPWHIAERLSQHFRVFLAGGLSPDNIAEAIQKVNPMGVDVVSGVEDVPGRKSFEAIDAFFSTLDKTQNMPEDAA
jgi:phosphoribosylanthranilate isomerase